jgi:hypothetical protein
MVPSLSAAGSDSGKITFCVSAVLLVEHENAIKTITMYTDNLSVDFIISYF